MVTGLDKSRTQLQSGLIMRRPRLVALCTLSLIASTILTNAQLRRSPPPQPRSTAAPAQIRATPAPPQPMRKPADLIHKQEPLKVNQGLLKECTPDNVHIVVSIPKQRAYLMIGDNIVADGPVSSGKR